jgi:hypothetical protein
VYDFGPLNSAKEGTVVREVNFNGQLIQAESWTGAYRWWDNPLLGQSDRTQLQFAYVDPNWGRKEYNLIVRELSDSKLVLAGIYDRSEYRLQRAQ